MEARTTDEGIYTSEWYTSCSDYYGTNYSMFTNNGNCLHYAISRVQEIAQERFPKFQGNAIAVSRLSFLERQEVPSFGALAVFGGTFAGHVAVVERVLEDGSILISQSSWQGFMFNTMTLYPQDNYSCYGMPLVGFYMFDGVTRAIEKEKKEQELRQEQIREEHEQMIIQQAIETGRLAPPPTMLPVDGMILMGTVSIQCFKKIGQKHIKELADFFSCKFFNLNTCDNDRRR